MTAPSTPTWSPSSIRSLAGTLRLALRSGSIACSLKDYLAIPDLVVVMAPKPVAGFLAERSYLPHGVPPLKQILALPGQTVCRIRLAIMIDGVVMATARERDHRGRPLPVWQGCRMIAEGEVFLMNWQSADSLDGRFFGPLPAASILGRAVPLWTFADP